MSPHGPNVASPEEKLLKLIRGPSAPKPRPGVRLARAGREAWSRCRSVRPAGWLRAVIAGLGVVIGLEGLTLLMLWTKPVGSDRGGTINAAEEVSRRAGGATPSAEEPARSLPAEEEFTVPSLASAVGRPMFQMDAQAPAAAAEGPVGAPQTDRARQLVERLSLIGLVSGDPPQAIIEDTETKKTYFVSVGQFLAEGLRVEDLRDNRITLSLHGEKFELVL